MSNKSRLDQAAEDILRTLNHPHEAVALAATSALQKARDAGSGPLRQQHLRSAQSHIARIDAARNADLVQRLQAQALALQGRGGDTAIAHVTVTVTISPKSMKP